MHKSAMESFKLFNETYLSSLDKPHIVEIGSLAVNASIKKLINKDHKYTGVDITAGENVDVVLKDPYKFPIDDNSVDVVISISTFEHVDFFWLTFLEILRILKKDGIFFLNVPSNGHIHRHDNDNWRFYPDSSLALEKWGLRNGRIDNNKKILNFTKFPHDQDNWGWRFFYKIRKFLNKINNKY